MDSQIPNAAVRPIASNPITIKTIGEYLAAANAIQSSWSEYTAPHSPWFRGQSNSEWKLKPSRYRKPFTFMTHIDEDQMMIDFKRMASGLASGLPASDHMINWLTIAQHHRLPTRLLDWTESALVALFFALHSTTEPEAPCVWVLNPFWLTLKAGFGYNIIVPSMHIDADFEDAYGSLTKSNEEFPVALRPHHITRRVTAQKGVFTLFGLNEHALESIGLENADDLRFLRLVLIAPTAVDSLRNELACAGMTHSTVFPDLDGLSLELAENARRRIEGRHA